MGLPKIEITFEQLAKTAIARSGRGTVALLLRDETGTQAVTEYKDVPPKSGWTAENMELIKMVFSAGTNRVLCVRVKKTGASAYDVAGTLDSIKGMSWDWCAAPAETATEIVAWIKTARSAGFAHKAVVAAATAPDSEGIVNLDASSVECLMPGESAKKTYSGAQFCVYVAGVLAALPLDKAATGYIFEPVVGVVGTSDAAAAVDAGKFVIMFNGTNFECARGVTSLTTVINSPALFKKIKHVEGTDIMSKDIAAVFKSKYRGKEVNTYDNKQALVADVIAYLKDLRGTVLSPVYDHVVEVDYEAHAAYLTSKGVDISTMSEMDILYADTGDTVFLRARVKLIDVMEDMTLSIALN